MAGTGVKTKTVYKIFEDIHSNILISIVRSKHEAKEWLKEQGFEPHSEVWYEPATVTAEEYDTIDFGAWIKHK